MDRQDEATGKLRAWSGIWKLRGRELELRCSSPGLRNGPFLSDEASVALSLSLCRAGREPKGNCSIVELSQSNNKGRGESGL